MSDKKGTQPSMWMRRYDLRPCDSPLPFYAEAQSEPDDEYTEMYVPASTKLKQCFEAWDSVIHKLEMRTGELWKENAQLESRCIELESVRTAYIEELERRIGKLEAEVKRLIGWCYICYPDGPDNQYPIEER